MLLACITLAGAAHIPAFDIDTTCSEFDRFVTYVNRARAGSPDYGYSATDAAILYKVTGDTSYARLAIATVEEQVTAAESSITAAARPDVAFDSYLYVGEMIRDVALTYDWAYDRLTPAQRTRWRAYADQAIYNVWNPSSAVWGSTSFPWSGWSIDNPGNNYHYSFLEATMYWAVASQNQTWMDYVRDNKLPPLISYFQGLPGGGSLEGTGYGTSHKRLFELYGFWKSATGQDLAAQSTHCRKSIDYWRHATVPTLDYFAPIGDQARVSDAPLYDYQRALVVRAILQSPGTPEAGRGMWWLNHISIRQMSSAFNLKDNIYRLPDPEVRSTDLAYYAPVLGDLFARTSWDTNAVWLHMKAGLFEESHAHEDQGSFSIYHNGWQAVTENIHTHSGIQQGTEVHNVIRFVKSDSTVIGQAPSSSRACSLSYQDDGQVLTARADLSNAYANEPNVNTWIRRLVFDRSANVITVRDSFSLVAANARAVWQLNTPTQPVVSGDSVIVGDLVVKSLDAAVQTLLLEWSTVDADEYRSGWKIELSRTDAAMVFNVRIRVTTPSTWVPQAVRPVRRVSSGRGASMPVCHLSVYALNGVRMDGSVAGPAGLRVVRFGAGQGSAARGVVVVR